MEYMVVGEVSGQSFVDSVSKHLDQGWVPQGGVCAYPLNNAAGEVQFLQALVKVEPERIRKKPQRPIKKGVK